MHARLTAIRESHFGLMRGAARNLIRARSGGVSSPECSVIMPVYNNADLTWQCLGALMGARTNRFEVIVVDDGSTDRTREVLENALDCIRVVRLTVNSGFAAACNAGAAVAKAEFLVFLNNDTVPRAGWLDALLRYVRQRPSAAVVGSKLLFPDGLIQHAGVVICQDLQPRHIYTGFPEGHPTVNVSRQFQAVTGACILVRRDFFKQLGGFDTAYTNGYEDTDLCLRARQAGLEVHYCHESVLVHLQSASRAGRAEEEFRNRQLFLTRWASRLEPDDLRYYVADKLLALHYGPTYPLEAVVSPELAKIKVGERRMSGNSSHANGQDVWENRPSETEYQSVQCPPAHSQPNTLKLALRPSPPAFKFT